MQALHDKMCMLLDRLDQRQLHESMPENEKQELEDIYKELSGMFDVAQDSIHY